MTYGFGKTYTIPAKFTALNGCIQYYKLTAKVALTSEKEITDESSLEDKMEVAAAQANFLRVLEVLRTYGGQPVITKANDKVVEFTLEQANVFGKTGHMQVSEKLTEGEDFDMQKQAVDHVAKVFANVKAVEAKAIDDKSFELVASKEDLFDTVEINEAF